MNFIVKVLPSLMVIALILGALVAVISIVFALK